MKWQAIYTNKHCFVNWAQCKIYGKIIFQNKQKTHNNRIEYYIIEEKGNNSGNTISWFNKADKNYWNDIGI